MAWDLSGISVWQFGRPDIPKDLAAQKPQPSTWGKPIAYFSNSTCNIAQYFSPMNAILNIALLGDWAGNAYSESCSGSGPARVQKGSNFKQAYWEVNSVR